MSTEQPSLRIFPSDFVNEQILGRDDFSLHAEQLGDVGDPSRSVAQTCGLNNDVNSRADHLLDDVVRKMEAAHDHHRYDAAYRVARGIRVQCAHRTLVPGIHRLQQIERLRPAHFANDDSLGPHAQAVLDQVAHPDLADALGIWRTRLEANDVRLLELQFGRVLAGDDSFPWFDIARQTVQQRRLA